MNTNSTLVHVCSLMSAFVKSYVEDTIEAEPCLHNDPLGLFDQGLQPLLNYLNDIAPFKIDTNSVEVRQLVFRAEQLLMNEIASNTFPIEEYPAEAYHL